MNCEWRFMLSRVRRTEKAYLLYQSAEACLRSALFRFCGIGRSPNSEESHRLYELEQCELAGVAVSLLVIVY